MFRRLEKYFTRFSCSCCTCSISKFVQYFFCNKTLKISRTRFAQELHLGMIWWVVWRNCQLEGVWRFPDTPIQRNTDPRPLTMFTEQKRRASLEAYDTKLTAVGFRLDGQTTRLISGVTFSSTQEHLPSSWTTEWDSCMVGMSESKRPNYTSNKHQTIHYVRGNDRGRQSNRSWISPMPLPYA